MLSIDEAIALVKIENECINRAENCNRKCNECELVQNTDTLLDLYKHLAEWLEELKAYKKNSNTCPMCDTYCSYLAEEFENGYNKAIDDFIKACDKKCGFYSGINKQLTRDMLLEIAEQLKEGAGIGTDNQ